MDYKALPFVELVFTFMFAVWQDSDKSLIFKFQKLVFKQHIFLKKDK